MVHTQVKLAQTNSTLINAYAYIDGYQQQNRLSMKILINNYCRQHNSMWKLL